MEQHKGKSITTSVPTFAIRFNAEDEELEDIYPSADEADDESDKQVMTVSSESSAATTAAHSRDPSPMKEYLKGLGKRSTSVDAGMVDGGTSGSDTWRIFHHLKGKITKTVEEKFGDIKSERKSSSVSSRGSNLMRGGKPAGGNGKDDSSISDSETASESSSKSKDPQYMPKPNEDSPEKTTDKQPKKLATNSNKTEKDDFIEENVKFEDPPETLQDNFVDPMELLDTPTVLPSFQKPVADVKTSSSFLRRRHKNVKSKGISTSSEKVSMSMLEPRDELEIGNEDEIESGVEASEDTSFLIPLDSDIDYAIPVIDYRTKPPTYTENPINTRRRRRLRHRLSHRIWFIGFLCIVCLYLYYFTDLPSFVPGFVFGVLVTVTINSMIKWLDDVTSVSENVFKADEQFVVPDYTHMPILEVPAAKEYQQMKIYCGWMNEYSDTYDPLTYSLSHTHSVYVHLQGSTMRISHTRTKIPKRAMWNEKQRKHIRFIHQRIYNIANCEIKLLPDGLARKRRWSKKYPICIVLVKSSKYSVNFLKNDNLTEEGSVEDLSSPISEPTEPTLNQDSDSSSLFYYEFKGFTSDTSLPEKENDEVSQQPDDDEFHDLTDDETFCHIDKTALDETFLYLFARTDREKEDWYRYFAAAVKKGTTNVDSSLQSQKLVSDSPISKPGPSRETVLSSTSAVLGRQEASLTSSHSQKEVVQQIVTDDGSSELYIVPSAQETADIDYLRFMSRFHVQVQPFLCHRIGKDLQKLNLSYKDSVSQGESVQNKQSSYHPKRNKLEEEIGSEVECDVLWINAFAGRIFYDIINNQFWVDKLRERIQKKLAAIKVPYFMETLLLTEVELSEDIPTVHRVSTPTLDSRGLWADVDVTYDGTAVLTIETKLNLVKLKEVGGQVRAATMTAQPKRQPDETGQGPECRSPMFDSDLDDTAESSSDDDLSSEEELLFKEESPSHKANGNTEKKVLAMVNRFAASKYFQQATEFKYIKRAIEGVSNTKIVLAVEVKGLAGTIALNIPPPPSDRLWYGFRHNPLLWISAHPKFGHRTINIGHVTSWIEKKLIQEFQKKFVYPNMDDIVIPPMTTDLPE